MTTQPETPRPVALLTPLLFAMLYVQPRHVWTHELDLSPYLEKF